MRVLMALLLTLTAGCSILNPHVGFGDSGKILANSPTIAYAG